jgi:hypothetical protein
MEYRFERRNGVIVFVVIDSAGVETAYPIAVSKARNLNAQLTAILKAMK